jgi:hypothetical protein
LLIRPAKVERDVAVGDVAAFGEAFLERGDRTRALIATVSSGTTFVRINSAPRSILAPLERLLKGS